MEIFFPCFWCQRGESLMGTWAPSQKCCSIMQERIQDQAMEWNEKADFIDQRGWARKAIPHKVYPVIQNLLQKWGNGTHNLHFLPRMFFAKLKPVVGVQSEDVHTYHLYSTFTGGSREYNKGGGRVLHPDRVWKNTVVFIYSWHDSMCTKLEERKEPTKTNRLIMVVGFKVNIQK